MLAIIVQVYQNNLVKRQDCFCRKMIGCRGQHWLQPWTLNPCVDWRHFQRSYPDEIDFFGVYSVDQRSALNAIGTGTSTSAVAARDDTAT
jgi:hypothetical protein